MSLKAAVYDRVNHCLHKVNFFSWFMTLCVSFGSRDWEVKDLVTCVYRAGTREVHNKLEKNRLVDLTTPGNLMGFFLWGKITCNLVVIYTLTTFSFDFLDNFICF